MNELTKEENKKLTRQPGAWQSKGGRNFNGDTSKLFNRLEIVKDLNKVIPYINLDFNETLVKIRFKYIKGDRGWKISNIIY